MEGFYGTQSFCIDLQSSLYNSFKFRAEIFLSDVFHNNINHSHRPFLSGLKPLKVFWNADSRMEVKMKHSFYWGDILVLYEKHLIKYGQLLQSQFSSFDIMKCSLFELVASSIKKNIFNFYWLPQLA